MYYTGTSRRIDTLFRSNFSSESEIKPFLEPATAGSTAGWARTTAIKYGCHVVAGYPQQVNIARAKSDSPAYFSSSIMVDTEGRPLINNTGRAENEQRPKFSDCLVKRRGKVLGVISIGKYTDLADMNQGETQFSNPQETEAFARHLLERHIDVGIISMAWKTIEKPRKLTRAPGKPDMDALTCWVARLMPLTEAEPGREILVALCNRIGFENDVMYSSTSTVLRFKDGDVHAYDILGGYEDGLLVVDTSKDPNDPDDGGFRLWPRPEENTSETEQVDEFSDGAGWPQREARSQETPCGGCNFAQNHLAKCTSHDKGSFCKDDASLEGRDYPLNVPPQPAAATKKPPRPKLLVPKSPSEPPQEIPAGKCRARVAAVQNPSASTSGPQKQDTHFLYNQSRDPSHAHDGL
ncbi:hypothetical protein LEL_07758 [Akanthomyces lecanii RCEF 1005]|uniref:Uncharacterized protein n=1 Tax=Akanthomyces lecanii RCEF 1005 TaxID=1081108 RepID=A0A168FY76_CORDF|nr:hypothetical protein LEL_07758 [Akanthomyces lecanii RCEF 1005]